MNLKICMFFQFFRKLKTSGLSRKIIGWEKDLFFWPKDFGSLFLLTMVFFLSINILSAQNISKHYTSSIQENGILYYIFPMKFKTSTNNLDFAFDITSLSSTDSVNINFSFSDVKKLVIDSFCLKNNLLDLNLIPKKIFVEANYKKWKYRYGFSIKTSDLVKLYNCSEKPRIYLICNGKERTDIKITKKVWKKQSKIVGKIIDLQSMNN